MALSAALKGPWNPFRITGTPMPPNLLLLCKLLAVAILATRHFRILPEPFLPFIAGLDRIADPAVFRLTLQTTCVLAAVALLCNRWVRASALLLGSCLLLGVVCSKAYYGNNKTFCGLALVLAGLSEFDRPAYLLRWQLSLVYFGAALNKLLDPDWQSGLFFQHWAAVRLHNPGYIAVAEQLPPLLAGKIMCWGTVLAEFAASLGLLLPRLVPLALWANVLFQVGLLEFTGTTFTLFFFGMQAATLAFVTWPEWVEFFHDGKRPGAGFLQSCARWLDPDGLYQWHGAVAAPAVERFHVVEDGQVYVGWAAALRLLLYSPVFWLTATALLALGDAAWWRRGLVAVILLLFLPLLLAQVRQAWQGCRPQPGS